MAGDRHQLPRHDVVWSTPHQTLNPSYYILHSVTSDHWLLLQSTVYTSEWTLRLSRSILARMRRTYDGPGMMQDGPQCCGQIRLSRLARNLMRFQDPELPMVGRSSVHLTEVVWNRLSSVLDGRCVVLGKRNKITIGLDEKREREREKEEAFLTSPV